MGSTLLYFATSLPLLKLSPPLQGLPRLTLPFLILFTHQAPEGAASCCFSLDATSCGDPGLSFNWKRLAWDEHRHGAILPREILKSVN